jgi:NAD(P)-dependent dehydrogenase (short-subunit alcohol dehydrogenase family)
MSQAIEERPLGGRTAIVTGSGRNIGRAIALALADQGANLVVNGHADRVAVDAVVEEVQGRGGRAIGVMADVGSDSDVAAMVRSAVEAFGSVDIVVSNVAIRRMQPFLEIAPEQWDEVLRTNLTAAYYLARHAIPLMRIGKWGRIVLVSGFDGFWGHVTHRAHNVTAKAGLHGLAMALAREFGPDNITANTVAPGAIDTVRDWTQYVHQPRERIEQEIPLGRFGKVEEVAAACELLCSDRGGFISGQVIHVNGGHFMY